MFIKKVTNNKNGIAYLTYRLVKSQRIEGIPKHINILELGSLSEIPLEKHKVLSDRIEQLMHGDTLSKNWDFTIICRGNRVWQKLSGLRCRTTGLLLWISHLVLRDESFFGKNIEFKVRWYLCEIAKSNRKNTSDHP